METKKTTVEVIKTTKRNSPIQVWNDEEYTRCSIKIILRPMLYALALCGCYSVTDIKITKNKTLDRKRTTCGLSLVYRLTLGLVLLSYIARVIAACFYLSNVDFYFSTLTGIWFLLCMVWMFSFWRASSKRFGKQAAAFKKWDKTIAPKFTELNLEYPVKRVKTIVNVMVVIAVVIIIANVASAGAQFSFANNKNAFTSPFEVNGYTISYVVVSMFVATLFYTLTSAYAAAVSFMLKYAFQTVTKAIQNSFRTHACSVPSDFQKLRILHNDLCNLVSLFDEDLGMFYTSLFLLQALAACVALYLVIRLPMDTYIVCLFIFWISNCLVMLGTEASFAAMVNTEAHAPLSIIYGMDVSDVNTRELTQINLFLSRLTGTQIGFSACGYFVITKEIILTIASVLLTYFAVLYTL